MFDYIIVQAGGVGSRMKHLTENKPKALVPVNNLPILFHLFRSFPDKKYIIIGDYKADVLRKYLEAFAEIKYILLDVHGKNGTCAGISDALQYLPDNESFLLTWSDLIFPDSFKLPDVSEDFVALSKGFTCRWRYENDKFEEMPSDNSGVAGLFGFSDKRKLYNIPESGEFVRWLKNCDIPFKTVDLHKVREFGTIDAMGKLEQARHRPFNRITESNGNIIKEGIDEQGRQLAVSEKNWYKVARDMGISQIPNIISFEPFVMERINGKNVYEYNLSLAEKQTVLKKIVDTLEAIHSLDEKPSDYFSVKEAYVDKTFTRLNRIRDLVPFCDERYITVNSRRCHNIFFWKEALIKRFLEYCVSSFKFIHGDCTFSNIMLRNNTEPVLIDPRGYFGFTKNYGDVAYDWAKVYYSILGNYDQFNLKKFSLKLNENVVSLNIESNNWEDMEDEFFRLIKGKVNPDDIKLIHAIIWLSLSTYAWEDYDSVCGAFYNGLYYLEEALFSNGGYI